MGWVLRGFGAGYSPSVPMVTAVSKGGGRQSHPSGPLGAGTPCWSPGLVLTRSDTGASLPHPGLGSSLPIPNTHHPLQKPLILVSAPVRSGPAHSALEHRARLLQLRGSRSSSGYGGTSGSKRELEPRPGCAGRRGLEKGVRSAEDQFLIGRSTLVGRSQEMNCGSRGLGILHSIIVGTALIARST